MDTGDNDDFNGQETVERKKNTHTHIMSEVYIKTKKKKKKER